MKTKGQKHYLHVSSLFGSSLNFEFSLEHSKIIISEPRNLLRIRLRLETFEDNAPVSTRWLANQSSTTSCKLEKGGGILIEDFYTA